MNRWQGAALLAAGCVTTFSPAAFPGVNGAIVFERRTGPVDNPTSIELFLIDPAQPPGQRKERRLTTTTLHGQRTPGRSGGPAFSPDGTRIAYASNAHPRADGRNTFEIYVMQANGLDPTRLTTTWAAPQVPASAGFPAWNPGGTRIAYLSHLQGGPAQAHELRVHDLAGDRMLTFDVEPGKLAWSPDGARIVFVRRHQLWSLDLASGQEAPLTQADPETGYPLACSPAWSPDGGRLLFSNCSAAGQPWKLWWMHADGSHREQVTRGEGHDSQPEWSPDGLKLAYVRLRPGQPEIHVRRAIADGSPDPRGPEDECLTHAPAGSSSISLRPTWQALPRPRGEKRGAAAAPAPDREEEAKRPRFEPPPGPPPPADPPAEPPPPYEP